MIINLSSDEMLDLWRLNCALLPLREDCVVERADGIDIDLLLHRRIRDWYLNLLDTAPVNLLAVTDIADQVAPRPLSDGSVAVDLPERCRRVVEVTLEGWNRPATIVDSAQLPVVTWQLNPYAMGSPDAPVAVVYDNSLRLYSAPQSPSPPRLSSLRCIIEPDDGTYRLHEQALALIPSSIDLQL